ncbi:MAG: hypothetical protein IMX05_02920 [Hydrogenibacillus schlegelii]|nr:hypothetical protein [Hydrogenibacillus schlegelii]
MESGKILSFRSRSASSSDVETQKLRVEVEGVIRELPEGYRETARQIEAALREAYPEPAILTALMLWALFAVVTKPRTRKRAVDVAAMVYLISQFFDGVPRSQKEVAQRYGVSPSSVTRRVRELADFFVDVLDDVESLGDRLEGDGDEDEGERGDFEGDEAEVRDENEWGKAGGRRADVEGEGAEWTSEAGDGGGPAPIVEPPFPSDAKIGERYSFLLHAYLEAHGIEDAEGLQEVVQKLNADPDFFERQEYPDPRIKAQMLLYDAWEANSPRLKKRLARQALKIYADAADAYVILAEQAPTPEKALELFAKGIVAGERDLGPETIEAFRGHLWTYVPARPYMRARAGFAAALDVLGLTDEAIREYEALLELNFDDHQGNRYPLLTLYLKEKRYEEAARLLKRYGEDASAAWAYGAVLVEYGRRGRTRKLGRLLDRAVEVNRHVVPFLLHRRPLPKVPPVWIALGTESEAVSYVFENGLLWWREKELMQWLRLRWRATSRP